MKTNVGDFVGPGVASVSLIQHIQDVYLFPGSSEDGQYSEGFGMIT